MRSPFFHCRAVLSVAAAWPDRFFNEIDPVGLSLRAGARALSRQSGDPNYGAGLASHGGMRGKANFLGHSIHPMLVMFPLGLLSLVPVFDVVRMATGNPMWSEFAFWLCIIGIAGGLVAAVPGFIDWLAIPHGMRAKRIGLTHAIVNVTAIGLFSISWVLRLARGVADPGVAPFILALGGLSFALVGGWFGGELVERLSMGVHDDANLNAPSSLDESLLMRRDQERYRPPVGPRNFPV